LLFLFLKFTNINCKTYIINVLSEYNYICKQISLNIENK